MGTSRRVPVVNWPSGRSDSGPVDDCIATEVPVALAYNRISHVVMMATPSDLEDPGLGFSLTEGLIGSPRDLLATRVIPRPGGIELAMTITEDWHDRLATQRRNLVRGTGCRLCGAENIEQALCYPQPVGHSVSVAHAALQRAVKALERHQPLQADTGATHGAAWCGLGGEVLELREDAGRHNALDKLIGGLFRHGFDPATGFALASSRTSYEMVCKTAAAGTEVLVAVSAPTSLAVEFVERSDLTLVGFARPGRHNVYTSGQRVEGWGAD